MLVVLVLKIKYSGKREDKQLCYFRKSTSLTWGNEFNEWYIIPNVSIYINKGFDISFNWLKIQYSNSWSVVTFEEEDEWASVHYNINNKENESSSV